MPTTARTQSALQLGKHPTQPVASNVTPTSGKNEVLPDPPRDKASSVVAASVKGFRASCEDEFGLSARYCSTVSENVTRPSGSLSKCCSSGANQGRAITAE